MDSFDSLESVRDALMGVNAFVCTLGSRVKYGETLFRQVDFQCPLNFAMLAKEIGVPHYGLLISQGSKASSWFLYMRVKGEVENVIKALDLPSLSIYQPGMIANRDGDSRCAEKIAGWIPFLSKI